MSLRDLVANLLLSNTKATTWRDRMGPAKFRGVEFFVERSERAGGRRGVVHEYPGKDDPFIEDMGRKARTFPVEGYVLGDQYMDVRDALIEKLEQEGPGELIHPYHGKRSVMVMNYRVTETRDAGGIAQFTIDFAETPAQPAQPTDSSDGAAKLKASAAKSLVIAGAEFLRKYEPGTLLDKVSDELRSATLAMNTIASVVTSGPQELAAFKRRIDLFEDSIESLVSAPEDMLADLTDLFNSFTSRKATTAVYTFDPGVRPSATTPSREQEQINFDATQALIQRMAVIQAATLIADETFDSYESAVAACEALADLIDEQAETADDDTYSSFNQLRADLTQAVPGDDLELAHLQPHTPPATIPSLVLAYQLYGDLDLESDILDRNKISHPGFVTAWRELEVLSRG